MPRTPEPSGSLPPPALLGLDVGSSPDVDRDWLPPAAELEPASDLPDRPPSPLARRASVLVPILVGLLLIAAAVALLWLDVFGQSGEGTEPPIAPTTGSGAQSGTVATPPGSPTSLAAASPPGGQSLATPRMAATVTPEQTLAVASPTATLPPIGIAIARDAEAVAGLDPADAVDQLVNALQEELPGRAVRRLSSPQQAAIQIGLTAPSQSRPYTIASAPLAVVTSPRLALTGVSQEQAEQLLRGGITDWAAVGAGLTLPVEPLALGDIRLEGARPVETYDDYDALVAGLEEHPGGVALVPVETVDWRVNVLAVDGIDPIRSTVVPAGYPFGQQLIAAVAADQPEEIDNAVQRAFARLGWPHRAPVITRIGVAGDIATNADGAELASLAPLIASLDLTIGNLGSGTSAATPTASTPAASSGESALASALADAGFDVISLITGESDDQTDRALREAGLETIGSQSPNSSQEPLIIERNGLRIAIVAARNDTTVPDPTNPEGASPTPLDPVALADEVQRLAAESDLVIVLLHVGPGGGDVPDPDMIAAARLAIDSGADAVVMTGAAGVSGMESYRDQPVLYGLGGLTGGGEAVETRQSAIVEFVCHGDRLVGLRLHGIEQDARGQPRLMTEAERAAFLDRLWRKMPEREDR